jgi:SAM-dependent methyltransferase
MKLTMQSTIETLFWLFVPIPRQSRFESVRLKLANIGFRYECPLCQARLGSLHPLGENFPVLVEKNVVGGRQRNARCPCCKSSDRERLIYLFLLYQTDLFSRPTKLLHVAPEKRLTKLIAKFSHLDYLTADLDSSPSRVMEQMDITDIHYPDASFDAILCNHVLEHVPEDRVAMTELYRVLRPGGWAILQVPISLTLDTTFEDPSISSPEERERAYGQHNHVRLYGRDYIKRLQSVGFIVNEFTWSKYPKYFGGSKNKYGLNPDEVIFFAVKQS